MPRRATPHRLSWEQLSALPLPHVQATLSIGLDGPGGLVTIGWTIHDLLQDVPIGAGVLRPAPIREAADVVRDGGAWLLEQSMGYLGPF